VAAPSQDTLCSHDIDRETYLTAFLSWWICFFLLPSSGARTIRPSVFVMASQIARGERVSLDVPVLANIYRSLRGLTSSRDPSRCRELVPWHFISGWLHMYWSSLYHPSLSSDLRAHLPILGDLAGTEPASLTPEDARFRFYCSVRPFFAPLTALKKELDDELRKKDTEIPLSVHWGIFI
jgi:Plant mobile domain